MAVLVILASEISMQADGRYCCDINNVVKSRFAYLLQFVVGKHTFGKAFKHVHKLWIIEWAFGWLDNYRRLSHNQELFIKLLQKCSIYLSETLKKIF